MKKIIGALLVLACFIPMAFAVPTQGNQTDEANWSDTSYVYVPVIKVLDSRDGYLVICEAKGKSVKKVVLPKKWVNGSVEEPCKLLIRTLPTGKLKPYMTVVKKGGEFSRVILTVPANRRDESWGVLRNGTKLDGLDKETLDDF